MISAWLVKPQHLLKHRKLYLFILENMTLTWVHLIDGFRYRIYGCDGEDGGGRGAACWLAESVDDWHCGVYEWTRHTPENKIGRRFKNLKKKTEVVNLSVKAHFYDLLVKKIQKLPVSSFIFQYLKSKAASFSQDWHCLRAGLTKIMPSLKEGWGGNRGELKVHTKMHTYTQFYTILV